MLKRTRKTTKGSTITIRLSDRSRYGLELACRIRGESLSSVAGKAINMLLDEEGIDSRAPGQLQSKLDRLWSPDGTERLMRVYEQAPELLTEEERDAFSEANDYIKDTGFELSRHEYAQRVIKHLNDICAQVEAVNKILNEESPD